jgi:hypothetical protein
MRQMRIFWAILNPFRFLGRLLLRFGQFVRDDFRSPTYYEADWYREGMEPKDIPKQKLKN